MTIRHAWRVMVVATDSGITFSSPDRETQPRAGISRILTAPLSPNANVAPVGTFTFTRLAN